MSSLFNFKLAEWIKILPDLEALTGRIYKLFYENARTGSPWWCLRVYTKGSVDSGSY